MASSLSQAAAASSSAPGGRRGGAAGPGRAPPSGRDGRGRGGGRGRGRGGRGRGRFDGGEAPVCIFFRQGRCNRGAECKFRHTQEAAAEGAKVQIAAMRAAAASSEGGSNQSSHSFYRSGSSGSGMGGSFRSGSKREFDPYKAEAIQRAKAAQDEEERPWSVLDGPFYSIDVECVATGYGNGHDQRLPGRIAMVDGEGNTVLDEVVRHSNPEVIVSYLTPLTGLTREGCEAKENKSIEEISLMVKGKLPKVAVLVGQSIDHDIDWLNLVKGVDYRESVDLASIFRQRIPKILKSAANAIRREAEGQEDEDATTKDEVTSLKASSSAIEEKEEGADDSAVGFPTTFRIFSLRHCCVHLLDIDIQKSIHDPADDAKYSILLFLKYRTAPVAMLRAVRDSLHRAPITPSFSADQPVLDGVCMSKKGYAWKHAARFIWRWWTGLRSGSCTNIDSAAPK